MPADVSGLEDLAAQATAARGRVYRRVSKVVAKTTNDIEQSAKGGAPVGPTGDLRESIKGTARGLRGRVEADIRYAAFVNFGTYKDAPQPFMTNAADRADATFAADAMEAAEQALEG